MTERSITEIIAGLATTHADASWRRFLDDFSPLIVHVARRYETDEDEVMNCYVYVCEKLKDRRFARLLKFDLKGPASFHTWLRAVTANLCIDWRRHRYGRFRLSPSISALPELEQRVFHQLYVIGFTRSECLHSLSGEYPALTSQDLSDICAQLHSLLSSRQRWQLSARTRKLVSSGDPSRLEQVEDPQAQTYAVIAAEQERAKLQEALAELSHKERLMLRFRYQQGLTLREVARLTGCNDIHQLRRQLKVAIARLSEYLNS